MPMSSILFLYSTPSVFRDGDEKYFISKYVFISQLGYDRAQDAVVVVKLHKQNYLHK